MRIVIDMQGAQSASRLHSAGQYSLILAQAIVRNRGEHEVFLVLNGLFPDTIEPIRAAFEGLLAQQNIRVWYAAGPVRASQSGNDWRRAVAEYLREAFIASLNPDLVYIASLFEGYDEDAVTSISIFAANIPTVVTLYSGNPLIGAAINHKQSAAYAQFCQRKFETLKRANGWCQINDQPKQHIDEQVVPRLQQIISIGIDNANSDDMADFDRAQLIYDDEVQLNSSWDDNGRKAIAIFETVYASSAVNLAANQGVQALIHNISAISQSSLGRRDVLLTAHAIAANHPEKRQKILYVDISHLVQKDMKTGIQRVTRSIVAALLNNPPANFQIKPVFATAVSYGYLHANRYAQQLTGLPAVKQQDEPIDPQPGDVFLGLDFVAGIVTAQQQYLSWLHSYGVSVNFVVYDLLPIKFPHCFLGGAEQAHHQWLQIITRFDGAICISRAVKDDLDAWLRSHRLHRYRSFKTDWFNLGADVESSLPTVGIPEEAADVINKLEVRPSFLMVGTLEPRKGHKQTLQAFEQLWKSGLQVNLVIVGKQGWMVKELIKKLSAHPELNRRLFWLQGVSDEYLARIYAASTSLVAASEDEGFGLPLIEAAKHKLPIIARDISVFREVAGDNAYYFNGLSANSLASAINHWLLIYTSGDAPKSDGILWQTWRQSADNLLKCVLPSITETQVVECFGQAGHSVC